MNIDLEIHHAGRWHYAGVIDIRQPELGYAGATVLAYDLDYWMANGAAAMQRDERVRDLRAVSVADPVDLENHFRKTWPPFLLDLMPSGRGRVRLAEALKIDPNARSSDFPLLMRAGGSPVGNVRIRNAADLEAQRIEGIEKLGVTSKEIFARSDRFIEIVDHFAIIASGSSGLQGEWPKIAMTQARDGLFYPDPLVPDVEAVGHVIVKLLRSSNERDVTILSAEAVYSVIAQHIGLNVFRPSTYENGVLMIPRFDRRVEDGMVARYGQESLVSAINVAEFAHIGRHEVYIDLIRRVSSDPFGDVVEYVKREAANLALGNSDNHGRNTALTKAPDLSVRLSPLFDFAPMRIAPESIARSTRWEVMMRRQSDHDPDWTLVSQTIFPDDAAAASALRLELGNFGARLQQAPKIAKELGAGKDVLDIAMSRCDEIVAGLKTAGSA